MGSKTVCTPTHTCVFLSAPLQVPELQLPIRFDTDVGGELADSAPGVGRVMAVSFNRCLAPDTPEQARLMRAGLLARRARAELLMAQLTEAAAAPEVDFVNPVIKCVWGFCAWGCGSGGMCSCDSTAHDGSSTLRGGV